MAMMVWLGKKLRCWLVSTRDKAREAGRMLGDVEALPDCEMKTLITPDHNAFQMRSSG